MEKFNIINIILLSIPEAILNIYIALLFVMENRFLPFKCDKATRKINVLKIIAFTLSYSLFGAILDHFSHNMQFNSLAKILSMFILIRLIYKITWIKSFTGMIVSLGFLIGFEAFYGPACVNIFYLDINDFFNGDQKTRILLSLAVRVAQLWAIVSLWNWKLVNDELGKYKLKTKALFITIALILIAIEFEFSQLYALNFNSLSINYKIIGGIVCVCCGLLNYLIFYSYIVIIREVAKHFALGKKGG
jgi:hypothetical protein